jgi:hypothetical protein
MGDFMKHSRFAILALATMTTSVSFAAPSAKMISSDEIIKTVLQRHVVLQGVNSKGSLGADAFLLKTASGQVIRANLRANASLPPGGASSNPEAFHVNMNMTTPAGTSQTMQLRFSGQTKESGAHTRILTYEAPMKSAYAGSGKLVAVVGQTLSPDHTWTTKSTYVRFLSK